MGAVSASLLEIDMTVEPDLQAAALGYVARGFALTWMAHGSKAPTHPGWNTHAKAVVTPDQVLEIWNGTARNIGIVHGLGDVKTCSLDVDQVECTRGVFAEFGFDLDLLRQGTPTVEGKPGNFRLLFRQPAGMDLPLVKLEWPGRSAAEGKITLFELRAGANQDVLPPSKHPSGKRYEWLTPLPDDPLALPEPPPALLELWTNWSAWLPELQALCPWSAPVEPKAAPYTSEARPHLDIIGHFNQAHDVRSLLEAHGYKPKGKNRYLPPHSTSGIPSVRILDSGKVFSSNGSCALNDGHAHDAFSVFCLLDHQGDVKAAIKAAAVGLGIELKQPRPEPQSQRTDSPPPEQEGYADSLGSKTPPSNAPPDPLRRAAIPAAPYPIQALGPILGPALEAVQRTVQAPIPLIAQSLLGAAALAAQGHANVVIDGRVIPLSLFLLTIGASGERKTGVDTLALQPVMARQRELVDSHKLAMADYKSAVRVWEQAESAAIKEKAADLSKVRTASQEKSKALGALGEAPEAPLLSNLLAGDPTSEGLFKLFANGQPSLGLFSDEGALFVGGHALARDARLRTIGALSKLWDGRPLDRVRGGDGASSLYDRRLSLHLMTQPLVAAELLADPIYQDQGFLARVLISWPDTTAGTRLYVNSDPSQEAAIGRYWLALTTLLYRPYPLRPDTRNELAPRALSLSVEAKAVWVTTFNRIERQLGEGGVLEPIRGFASKAAEHAARLAGVLTLIAQPEATVIDANTITCGLLLMDYYLTEALRIHDSGIADPELQAAQRLLDWLHGLNETHVHLAKVYQCGPSGIRDAKTARRLLDVLVKHRWLTKLDDGVVIDGKLRKDVWRINRQEAAL